MGYISALGIADTDISLEQQVSWHFSSNCYPPVPQLMVPVAVEAIELVAYDDDKAIVELPEGVSWRGQTSMTARDIVEHLFLWAFVEAQFSDEGEE